MKTEVVLHQETKTPNVFNFPLTFSDFVLGVAFDGKVNWGQHLQVCLCREAVSRDAESDFKKSGMVIFDRYITKLLFGDPQLNKEIQPDA